MRSLTLAVCAGVVLAGCGGSRISGGALGVTVVFAPGSKSTCVRVGVQTAKGQVFETNPLARPATGPLKIGVKPATDLDGVVTPYARGYLSADCSGNFIEEDRGEGVDLGLISVQHVILTLDAAKTDGGVDGGVDGGCVPIEICTDGLDNDCDNRTDCLDLDCAGLGCNDNDLCTSLDSCWADAGCSGTPMVCASPAQCEISPGRCAAGACLYDAGVGQRCNGDAGICRSDKSCVDAGAEVFCGNGADDDLDSLTDCFDPDCAAQACDGGVTRCFSGQSCSGTTCLRAGAITCTPINACFAPAGTCLDATGCPFTLRDAGVVCDGGFCRDDGGCFPNENCLNGADDDGDGLADCLDPECNLLGCDDGNPCTVGTTCASSACGGGATCSMPPICFLGGGGACPADGGGCAYRVPNTFASCPGGSCGPDGGCIPDAGFDAGVDAGFDAGFDAGVDAGVDGGVDAGFPYTPSNFILANVPPAGLVNLNCLVTFNSTDAGVTGNWCGGAAPAIYGITQQGSAEPAVVLSMNGLNITDGGELRLVGNRAVILAVFGTGQTNIDGVINARSLDAGVGAGGNRPGCGAQNGGDGGSNGVIPGSVRASGGGGAGAGSVGFVGGTGDTGNIPGGLPGGLGPSSVTPLRGGCRGGNGGGGITAGGPGGAGGGAIQLSVAGNLRLAATARVTVSAMGGFGGPLAQRAAGGGGGSGGGLLLEAAGMIAIAGARLTANGGAGGEGGDADEAGVPGANGSDLGSTPALGGSGGASVGGAGGNGAAGGLGATAGTNDTIGGGGGGGFGRIHLRVSGATCTVPANTASPAHTNAGGCP